MITVIKIENGKWTWKERDAKGNSVRVGNERFDSELEAHKFVEKFPKDESKLAPAPEKKSIDDTIADSQPKPVQLADNREIKEVQD